MNKNSAKRLLEDFMEEKGKFTSTKILREAIYTGKGSRDQNV
jgi:hypothetical protein